MPKLPIISLCNCFSFQLFLIHISLSSLIQLVISLINSRGSFLELLDQHVKLGLQLKPPQLPFTTAAAISLFTQLILKFLKELCLQKVCCFDVCQFLQKEKLKKNVCKKWVNMESNLGLYHITNTHCTLLHIALGTFLALGCKHYSFNTLSHYKLIQQLCLFSAYQVRFFNPFIFLVILIS